MQLARGSRQDHFGRGPRRFKTVFSSFSQDLEAAFHSMNDGKHGPGGTLVWLHRVRRYDAATYAKPARASVSRSDSVRPSRSIQCV